MRTDSLGKTEMISSILNWLCMRFHRTTNFAFHDDGGYYIRCLDCGRRIVVLAYSVFASLLPVVDTPLTGIEKHFADEKREGVGSLNTEQHVLEMCASGKRKLQ